MRKISVFSKGNYMIKLEMYKLGDQDQAKETIRI